MGQAKAQLMEMEEKAHLADLSGRDCIRCGEEILKSELELNEDQSLCGYCHHMCSKAD